MINKKDTKNTIQFLYEVGTLRKIPRAHMQALFTNDLSDNIASHSFRVTLIGWLLAEAEGANINKVIKMCLLHDIPETRSGDQNYIHKKYVQVYENQIKEDQLGNLPEKIGIIKLSEEYDKRKTLAAKVAKDADTLDQVFLLKEYSMSGNKEATEWLSAKDIINRKKRLFTKTAKKWVNEITTQNPSDWWLNVWTSKRR